MPGVGEGRVEGRDVGGLRDEGEGLGQEAVRRGEIVGRRHAPPSPPPLAAPWNGAR